MRRALHGAFRGVVFDMDGTLTKAALIDFAAMRSRLQLPPRSDILAHVDALDGSERRLAIQAIVVDPSAPGGLTLSACLNLDQWIAY